MSDRPIEELKAGDAFRKSVIPKADGDRMGAPLWHGWVIMEAFLAGIDYARKADGARSVHPSQARSET